MRDGQEPYVTMSDANLGHLRKLVKYTENLPENTVLWFQTFHSKEFPSNPNALKIFLEAPVKDREIGDRRVFVIDGYIFVYEEKREKL